MRLWTLHPKYLDAVGLVALWREGLLAQAVLAGKMKAYANHPQLVRFRRHNQPLAALGFYLNVVWEEARGRGYRFRRDKILAIGDAPCIVVPQGQVLFEREHLARKLEKRGGRERLRILWAEPLAVNPSFVVVPGGIAAWEKASAREGARPS